MTFYEAALRKRGRAAIDAASGDRTDDRMIDARQFLTEWLDGRVAVLSPLGNVRAAVEQLEAAARTLPPTH